MIDESTIEAPCPSGGAISATVVRSHKGTRYIRLARVYRNRDGEPEETGLIPANVEALSATARAHAQAVVMGLFESIREGRARKGRPPDDSQALQDAIKQLPAWAQALLPAEELAQFGVKVQALATHGTAP